MKKGIAIILILVILLAGGTIYYILFNAPPDDLTMSVRYTELHPSELVNSIDTTGTVESVKKSNVYTLLGLTVQEVYVEVGDRVEPGQTLCILDTEDLVLNIAQQKADLNATQQSNYNQLQNNQRVYDEAVSNLESGTNSALISAEYALSASSINLSNAQKNYNNALKEYRDGTNSALVAAKSNLLSAEIDLSAKETLFESNKVLYEAGDIPKNTYDQSADAYTIAQNKYDDAVITLENVITSQKNALDQFEAALKSAQVSYDNANDSLSALQTVIEQDLEKYKNNVENSQIAIDNDFKVIGVQKLEKQLEESVIKSPAQGTVTAVYAKEGAAGAGLLFVIEDTEHLKISTKVKEYDVVNVRTGMSVTVKSDATGDAVYEGVISKIAPTSLKNASGETAATPDIEFAVEVELVSSETDLKVGMNARLNLELERKESVFFVPYTAVRTNEYGEYVIYTAIDDGLGGYTARRISVTRGMKTDSNIEIVCSELADGMKVITDAPVIMDGMQVSLIREPQI
ncbi:MAG: HlyD family efflux transporter periplasmic adaptor subunit [Oscillospiraceae bacterium]|nr:HlyD family efflux transporter periplasmic adaptor subunit [Oscillospiraceae bacterium]